MRVKQLIEILKTLPEDFHVATHVFNHTFIPRSRGDYDETVVGILSVSGYQEYVVIGNPYRLDINYPNWYIVESFTKQLESRTKFEGRRIAYERKPDGFNPNKPADTVKRTWWQIKADKAYLESCGEDPENKKP